MALDKANQKRRLDSIAQYYKIFGKKLLDKISRKKHGVNFDQLISDNASNLKTRLIKFQDFILANKRAPTDFEARSLAHELSRGPRELKVQMSLLEDLKTGPIKVTPESLAKKYGVSVDKLKEDANNLQRNIWRKRMGNNPNTVKQYPLKWMVDEGNDFDNVLNNLYKAKVIKYERNKIRDLFYDAFGRKNLEGSNIKNPTYSPKKWAAMRSNWNDYNKIRNAINKKYPNIVFELDHPLSKATLKNYFEATPSQLTRVNPMAAGLNRGFKKVLDERYGNAIKNQNREQVKALNKIAKDLNINFGKVSKDFTKFDYGVKPFEKLNIRKSMADALTQQQNLSTKLPKYTKANPKLFAKAGIDLKTIDATVPEMGIKAKELKKLVKNLVVSKATLNEDNICSILGLKRGGLAGGGCGQQMELAFDEAPEQTLNDIAKVNSPKLKSFAQRALSLLPKLGTPGKIAAGAVAGAAAIGALTYNKELGEFVNPLNDDKASQATVTEWIKDNPVKTVAGTSIGFSAQEIPGAYKKARELGRGRVRSALGITGALKPVLTTFGTPAMTALFEAPFAAKRLEEGETMAEVLTDPLGPALGLSLMEPLSKGAGVIRDVPKRTWGQAAKNYFDLSNVGKARPGISSKILRMGMSPRMIAGASRFLGLPGLALSLGLTGYGAYKNYQNEEGMLYNLFNKNE